MRPRRHRQPPAGGFPSSPGRLRPPRSFDSVWGGSRLEDSSTSNTMGHIHRDLAPSEVSSVSFDNTTALRRFFAPPPSNVATIDGDISDRNERGCQPMTDESRVDRRNDSTDEQEPRPEVPNGLRGLFGDAPLPIRLIATFAMLGLGVSAVGFVILIVAPEVLNRVRPSSPKSTLLSSGEILLSTSSPSQIPSPQPSALPSAPPSEGPTSIPSASPSSFPSSSPSPPPSSAPSSNPTFSPTVTPITFYVMGDTPYTMNEGRALRNQISKIPSDASFVVHVGDMQTVDLTQCEEESYIHVRNILHSSPHPVFIIPGDNDVEDCPNATQAWQYWTRHLGYLDKKWPHSLNVKRQSVRPENFAFYLDGVVFIGINLVGGRSGNVTERAVLINDDLSWTISQINQHHGTVDGVVIFGHARPRVGHKVYFTRVSEAAMTWDIPTLYLHGDGHKWEVEEMAFNMENMWRVQVDRGGIAAPLRVRFYRENRHQPFQFTRR